MQMQTSSRVQDFNGWTEIKGNPISKVGVFPYFGSQIQNPNNPNPDIIPDKIYYVYRPAEELAASECLESFKLVPWIDDHEMLGPDYTPTEYKGIDGVTGETVYFDGEYLRANLKIFSNKLADLIAAGKKELSIGYRSLYEHTTGVYNGERYDAIQRCIRGNHLALVIEGRSGPDVAVQDHFKFTFDGALLMEKDDEKKPTKDAEGEAEGGAAELTIPEIMAKFNELQEPIKQMQEFMAKFGTMMAGKAEETDESISGETEAEPVAMDAEKMKTMDAKIKKLQTELSVVKDGQIKTLLREVSQRDALANRLAPFIGVFDHKEKSLNEVAQYAIKTLGIKCEAGQEIPVLNGFLLNRQPSLSIVSLDSNASSADDDLSKYIKGVI